MSATATTRLGLIKPTPGTAEPVNVETQINDSWDMIDYAIGTTICTNATRPTSPFHGQLIQETDTDSIFYHNGASPASGGWVQILTENNGGVTVCTSSTRPSSPSDGQQILETDTEKQYMYNGGAWRQVFMDGARFIATVPGGGSDAGFRLYTSSSAVANRAISLRGSGDTFDDRFFVDFDGTINWGPGTAACDTNLYRSSANVLRTDDALSVGGGLTVTGTINASGIVYTTTYSGTTSATGLLTVTHGAPWTPVAGWAITTNPEASFAGVWGIDQIGATTCRLRFQNIAGTGSLNSASVSGRLFLVK